jgi:hypothetical protein
MRATGERETGEIDGFPKPHFNVDGVGESTMISSRAHWGVAAFSFFLRGARRENASLQDALRHCGGPVEF